MIMDAEILLAGPRGRRLCLELVMEMSSEIRSATFWLAHDLDLGKGSSRVMLTATADGIDDPLPTPSMMDFLSAVGTLDVSLLDNDLIDSALAQAVDTSRPWQEPDGEDVLAGLPEVRTAHAPVARRLVALPSTQWWAQSRQIEQWAIDWRSPDDRAPLGRNPAQLLSTWALATRAEEVRAQGERPRDPTAILSGTWWSFPQGALQSIGRIPLGLNLAYLGSANRALQVDVDTATVIAGWNPDTTIWLTDSAREWAGPRWHWRRLDYQDPWERVDA